MRGFVNWYVLAWLVQVPGTQALLAWRPDVAQAALQSFQAVRTGRQAGCETESNTQTTPCRLSGSMWIAGRQA